MVVDSTGGSHITPQEQVRRRPGMFVGGTDEQALHQLAYEILNHAVNAALAGQCQQIQVYLHPDDFVTIQDDGPGIYTEEMGDSGRSFLELLMTDIGFYLKQRAKDQLGYKVEGGMHGVGLGAMNALCQSLRVENMYRHVLCEQSYQQGVPVTDMVFVRRLEKGESNGTTITFQPDPTIFETTRFDFEALAKRLEELAVLIPNLTLTLRDERDASPREVVFQFTDGLRDFVTHLSLDVPVLHDPLANHYLSVVTHGMDVSLSVEVDFAFVYNESADLKECTYVNTVLAAAGGVHVRAIYSALADRINEKAHEFNLLPHDTADFTVQEIQPGLITLLSIKHPDPQFAGALKKYLTNWEVYGVVAGAVYQTPIPTQILEVIVAKCLENRRQLG